MNAIVVDTSSWISYFAGKGHPEIDTALSEGRVYLPPIVAAELLSGRLKPADRKKLTDFLNELPLCRSDLQHWAAVGELRSRLLATGVQISTPDAHVVQCALDLNCYLLGEDKIFLQIAPIIGLRLTSS